MYKIRTERGKIKTDTKEIQSIVRQQYENYMLTNWTTWMKWIKFPEAHNLPN